jgi:hypothetical protein
MKRISLIKKIKLFNEYKNIIDYNSKNLLAQFNIRIDYAYRMYTVLNINPDEIGEAFSLKKADIDKISESYIRQYSSNLSKYLDDLGLKELFDYYKVEKVDKYSYLIVYGFSQFKSQKYYNFLYYVLIPTLLTSIITSLIIFL